MAIAVTVLVQAASAAPTDDVVVVGSRESFKMSMRAVRAAQSEFARNRAEFAPDATLTFLVERTDSAVDHALPKLYVSDGAHRTAIDVGPDNSFSLPSIPRGKWWLEANLTSRQMKITSLVLSPRSTRYAYRLGDARLQCRVTWAMIKTGLSILEAPIAGMMDLAGTCSNQRIGIYVSAPAAVRSVTLQEGSRASPVAVSANHRSYHLPVSDPTFSNEAQIRLTTE